LLRDSNADTSTQLVHGGGQTELWQRNAGVWNQIWRVGSDRSLAYITNLSGTDVAQEVGFRAIRWIDIGANYNTNGTETGRGLRIVSATTVRVVLLGGDNITIINETAVNHTIGTSGALLHIFSSAGVVSVSGDIALLPGGVLHCHAYDGASWRVWGSGILGGSVQSDPRVLWSLVNATGAIVSGVGIALASHPSTGTYQFTFTKPFQYTPAVTVTVSYQSGNSYVAIVTALNGNGFTVQTYALAGTLGDQAFSITAIGA
jgi:hypothetical protein